MLGHHHISRQGHAVFRAHLFERFDKDVSRPSASQQSKSAIATERNEMQMALALVAFEVLWHHKVELPHVRPFGPPWATRALNSLLLPRMLYSARALSS